mgnify:CR=1 FL=1
MYKQQTSQKKLSHNQSCSHRQYNFEQIISKYFKPLNIWLDLLPKPNTASHFNKIIAVLLISLYNNCYK